MKEKYKMYIAHLIKEEKKKQGMSSDDVARICNISRSYVSKLEKGTYIGDVETVCSVLNKLKIYFVYSGEVFDELQMVLDEYYKEMTFGGNVNEFVDIIRKKENAYIHSTLYANYVLMRFVNAVLSRDEIEKWMIEFERISEIIKIENKEHQIFWDFKGVYFKNLNQQDRAIACFLKAKEYGIFENSYPLICYHLSISYEKKGDLINAYVQGEKAVELFSKEYNWKRTWYADSQIANLYSRLLIYDVAEEAYKRLKRIAIEVNNRIMLDVLNANMMWNRMKQHEWMKALELAHEFDDHIIHKITYFHIAFSYYKLKQFKTCIEWVDKGKKSGNLDLDTHTLLTMLELLVEDDHSSLLEYLEKLENETRENVDCETRVIILLQMRKCAEGDYKYKIANDIATVLLKLQVSFDI